MKLFEMEGFLRGKCIPRDLKVNETNAEYLVRKFAEADAMCAAMAAELRAVEAIHNEAVFITDDRYEQCPPEVQKIIRSLAVMQIPAYQAFLAEVRAQGVERLANAWYAIANETDPGISISDSSRLKYRQRADDAADFANEIRQEAAQ